MVSLALCQNQQPFKGSYAYPEKLIHIIGEDTKKRKRSITGTLGRRFLQTRSLNESQLISLLINFRSSAYKWVLITNPEGL